jgi:hypothetical protein
MVNSYTQFSPECSKKLRADLTKTYRFLEWFKGFGAGAAMLLGIAALGTLGLTYYNTSLQRHDDELKRRDAEFVSAVERVSAPEPSTRLSAVVSLSRFVHPGYKDYTTRALPVLVARLRFEPDIGIRRLIQQIAIDIGPAVKPALLAVRQDARLELLRPPERELTEYASQKRILQQAFVDASYAITSLDHQPLDLSTGLLDEFQLPNRDLPHTNLNDASLRKVDLSTANLEGASLNRTVLRLAQLRQANLSGADLKDTDFTCADVMGANFTNARNLTPEQFAYTNWRDATFSATERRDLEARYPEPDGSSVERTRSCRYVDR